MAYNIENYNTEMAYSSTVTTAKPWSFGSTVAITGAVTLSSTLASGALTVTGAVSATGLVTAKSGTTDTAGGVQGLAMGNGAWSIYYGSGAPTIATTSMTGNLYLNTTSATTATLMYVNLNGTTAWKAVQFI